MSKATHPSNDQILSELMNTTGIVGSLVTKYPGKRGVESNSEWLDDWFESRVREVVSGKTSASLRESEIADEPLKRLGKSRDLIKQKLRIVSVKPHYFRGFRTVEDSIDVNGDLVVLEGRNSSGKTSLAESLEWLFTGQLKRRITQNQGNPKELKDCIQSQLRPNGEDTSVEATFSKESGEMFKIKRKLVKDYEKTSKSRSISDFYLNGEKLSATKEKEFLETHFASIAPLLMQHTLGEFVHSTPIERRAYFESLLNLDEITSLIEHAVVGSAMLKELSSDTGSKKLLKWNKFELSLEDTESIKQAKKLRRMASLVTAEESLLEICNSEFESIVKEVFDLVSARKLIEAEQKKIRESQFPLLKNLKPKRVIDQSALEILTLERLKNASVELLVAATNVDAAKRSLKAYDQSQKLLVSAVKNLVEKGLLNKDELTQNCPLCEATNTLQNNRIGQILSMEPLTRSVSLAKTKKADAINELKRSITELNSLLKELFPDAPEEKIWEKAVKNASASVAAEAEITRGVIVKANESNSTILLSLGKLTEQLSLAVDTKDYEKNFQNKVNVIENDIGQIEKLAPIILEAVGKLENSAGVEASRTPEYEFRESWLDLVANKQELVDDFKWEKAKTSVQKVVKKGRGQLIDIRQFILDARRESFSSRMSEIWSTLRQDRYSAFKDLHIPPPRGKGFPVSIDVRATLDDNKQKVDVDALRVFSESQTNVLGIAAFLTRSINVGHSFLILDDPVQSMDEEHFKTLADGLISWLLEEGFQVVVLTHNDTFARDVGFSHSDNPGYVTLKMKHSRRTGCNVIEGNRRVTERLKQAEKLAEEGDMELAWRLIRLSLERLYTLTFVKHSDSNFDPRSWQSASAEGMWNAGVGDIIESLVPDSGKKLKEMLDLTAAGAHDKAARGATDLIIASKYIKGLLSPLRVGG